MKIKEKSKKEYLRQTQICIGNSNFSFADNRTQNMRQKQLVQSIQKNRINLPRKNNIESPLNNNISEYKKKQPIIHETQYTTQFMTFSRFTRYGMLTNWGFYSGLEMKLLQKEETLKEQLNSFEFVHNDNLNNNITILKNEFQNISEGDYEKSQYEKVDKDLDQLQIRADNLCSKLVVWGKLFDNFNATGKAKNPPKNEITPLLLKLANESKIYNLPELRELLDIVIQVVNDSIILSEDNAELFELKKQVISASIEIQESFFTYIIKQDENYAFSRLYRGCEILKGINYPILETLISNNKVNPKSRENNWRIDIAAMTLARSTILDKISPSLVVGLPTAGAHIASRYAASYKMITGVMPEVNLTRAHAVKADSKEVMKGINEEDYFKSSEFEELKQRLSPLLKSKKELTIFIVDDGMVSGNTLIKTKLLYTKKMKEAGFNVNVVLGLARGNSYHTDGELIDPDYIFEPKYGRGGAYKALNQIGEYNDFQADNLYILDNRWSDSMDLNLQVKLVQKDNQIIDVKISELLKPIT